MMRAVTIAVFVSAFLGTAASAEQRWGAMACLEQAAAGGGLGACEGAPPHGAAVDAGQSPFGRPQAALEAPAKRPSEPRPSAVPDVVVAPAAIRAEDGGFWAGTRNGAVGGAKAGAYGILYPAVYLAAEGFGREMSRYYDGTRPDNGHGKLFTAAGTVLAVLLAVPALAAAVVGGIGGALAGGAVEAASPGATRRWDPDTW